MDAILGQQQLDEYGLPVLPENMAHTGNDLSEEEIKKFLSGNFSGLGLAAPSSLPTPAEAQREARERSTEVLSQWSKLQQILERHEDVLRRRWIKKTKTQRTSIVLQAWPKMSSKHRPDYEAFRKEGPQLESRGTRFREAYMWPYINVEDLVRGKTLLLFLNSRGRHPPYMFAHADFEAMRLGHISSAVMPAFLNVHTMFLDGEVVETYGRLVAWDDEEDAMEKLLSGLAYQPGQGLLILEIQQRILHFLVEFCHAILHDFTPDALIGDVPIKPEPPSIVDNSEWPTLASIAAEAPYRLPARIDFIRLKALVAARRTSAEDYIRGLREDPGYFADVLGDWSEHRQEKLLDTNRARHPVLKKPLFWERVIGNVVMDAYEGLIIWDIISEQLTHLAALQEKYSDIITPQKALPPEYLKALLTVRYTLSQVKKGFILLLKTGLPASPPFRSTFVREPHTPGSNIIRVQSRDGSDRMMWLFNSLWTDRQLELLGLPGLMDEIENLIQSDPKEKARLSSWVARVFSDLGLIARVQHELDIYQPWASSFEHEFATFTDEIEEDFRRRFATFAEVDRNLKGLSVAKFGDPTDGRFNYPSDKRRTKQTTESMQNAEHNLDLFWEKVDEHCRQKTGLSIDQALHHIFTDVRQLERTPEWIEPIRVKKNAVPATTKHYLHEPFSALQLESANFPSGFVPPQLKIKSKTRGSAHENPDTTQDAQAAPLSEEDTQPTFTLKNRAFKVFKALFFNPAQSDLPGDISWTDFLHAMAATGFAPEKLYGSIWLFTPSKLDVERSIQFHEPHPIGKIPFRNARRIGRRLSRAYGWHGGMFALE